MMGFIQLGQWLFIVLASAMGLMVANFLVSQWKKSVSLGPKMFGAIGTGMYFVAAYGVFRWLAWSYLLGIFVVVLTLAVSSKGVFKAANLAAGLLYTGLWLMCLVWFLLPTVRHRFGS